MTTTVVNNEHTVPKEWHDKWFSTVNRSSPQFKKDALDTHNNIGKVLDSMSQLLEKAKRGNYYTGHRMDGQRSVTIGDHMCDLLNFYGPGRLSLLKCVNSVRWHLFIDSNYTPDHHNDVDLTHSISLGVVAQYLHSWSKTCSSRALAVVIAGAMNNISFRTYDDWYTLVEQVCETVDHQARQNSNMFRVWMNEDKSLNT
jgi:hypothetical protein